MVQGYGRRQGLVTLRMASAGAGTRPGLLRPRGSLTHVPHQRLGFPPPLPHQHHHTEKQKLLVSTAVDSSQARRSSQPEAAGSVHMSPCVFMPGRWENQIGEEAKQGMGRR